MVTPPVALAIAGTDSGGGAGLAADLLTYAALGVHGASVVTAVTAQDTTGVHAIHPVPFDVVAAQLEAVLADLEPAVVKTGMLATADVARLVAGWCAGTPDRPLVIDPVLRATTGAAFADEELLVAYGEALLPVATVVTPNAAEARVLLGLARGDRTPPRELAVALADRLAGPAVVVTGGPDLRALRVGTDSTADPGQICTNTEYAHGATSARPGRASTSVVDPGSATCTDWLARPGHEPLALSHPAVATTNDHGTGCTYASALAAYLARGEEPEAAAASAAVFVSRQLATGQTWRLGRGRGPIAHADPTSVHTKEKR